MSFQALLGQRNFRWLWIGQICSQLGDRLTQMILIAIVGARAPGSTLALSTMMAWTVFPAFVVSPLAGAYVDRWDRRRVMVVCDLARGALVLAFPLLVARPEGDGAAGGACEHKAFDPQRRRSTTTLENSIFRE